MKLLELIEELKSKEKYYGNINCCFKTANHIYPVNKISAIADFYDENEDMLLLEFDENI